MNSENILIFLVIVVSACNAARILAVIPTPSISHQMIFRPLTQELAKRGHQVMVITTDPVFPKGQTPENFTEIDVHDISYKLWREEILSSATTSGKSHDIVTQVKKILHVTLKVFEAQMLSEQVQKLLNEKASDHFDLLLVEACVRSAVSISHVYKAPVIIMSSFAGFRKNYDVMGIPMRPPLLYPTLLRQRINDLSLWEKMVELYHHYKFEELFKSCEAVENETLKRLFGPDIPPITELENNVHMMFMNVHPLWEFNRPVPSSVIFIGGIHQKPSKELPKELKSYLDTSKNGVIYISFGTNINPSTLPSEKIQMLIAVFSKLPYDILWKWDQDKLPGKSGNIRISKWFPQADLLLHPKVKLFITQGGLQSTDEAITAGVPLIGMPMFGDQWYNVEKYIYYKIGIRLDMETMTEDEFLNGINTLINDDSYAENVVKLRKIITDQPQKPLERAMWWTEYVLRHGGASHLRPRTANMPWSEYLDIQLMGVLIIISALFLALLCAWLYYMVVIIKRAFSLVAAKEKRC